MEIDDFLGEEVVDRAGETVGTFACYWHSFEGKAFVLGIEVDEDSEHTRIVPARGMRMNERHSCLRIPFSRDQVNAAPGLDCDEELDTHHEEDMYKHYDLEAPKSLAHLQIRRMSTN